jgi:hypothetical protein
LIAIVTAIHRFCPPLSQAAACCLPLPPAADRWLSSSAVPHRQESIPWGGGDSGDSGGDDVVDNKEDGGDGGDAREVGIDTHINQLKAAAETAVAEILVAMAWRKPILRTVWIGTFGAPDQGQTLDVYPRSDDWSLTSAYPEVANRHVMPHRVELQILQFYVRVWYRTDRHFMISLDLWMLSSGNLNDSIILSSSFKSHKII